MSNNNIHSNHITPPDYCTGCALCSNICPKTAITMVWSEEGFLIPDVDTDLCIDCGLCIKKCPALIELISGDNNLDKVVAYGGWNADAAIQRASSSGGVFSALAEFVIQQSGCVFGVVWKNSTTAVFAKAESLEELAPMRGSKYTQAIPGYVYREVKEELIKNRYVLFSGTACQVHALRCYLKKDYDKLLTLDIVCHGVPSHKILESYISDDQILKGKKIDNIYFREKDGDWLRYKVKKRYTDGSSSSCPSATDVFMNLFLSDYVLNRACYNCPHAHFPRPGDLTLGDYWGVQHLHSDWPIPDGISSLIANTEKGNAILQKLSEETKISLTKEPFPLVYQGQPHSYLRSGRHVSEKRDQVLSMLKNSTLEEVHNHFCKYARLGGIRINRGSLLFKLFVITKRFIKIIFHH